MHSTLRSEVDVFRLAVIIAAGAIAVIALALITEPRYGAVLAAVLIVLGIVIALRRARGREQRRVQIARDPGDGRHRILLVANATVTGKAPTELGDRARGRDSEVLVVSPTLTGSGLKRLTADDDRARAAAERRCRESVSAIEATGLRVRGEVGDADPNVAIESALLRFPADEVVICNPAPGGSGGPERGVVEKARAEVELPVTQIVIASGAREAVP